MFSEPLISKKHSLESMFFFEGLIRDLKWLYDQHSFVAFMINSK